MDPRVQQMIDDATTIVERKLAAGDKLASEEFRPKIDIVSADLPAKYRGCCVGTLNLALPLNESAQFLLVIVTGYSTLHAATYAVTRLGELKRAKLGEATVAILEDVDAETVVFLAEYVHDRLSY